MLGDEPPPDYSDASDSEIQPEPEYDDDNDDDDIAKSSYNFVSTDVQSSGEQPLGGGGVLNVDEMNPKQVRRTIRGYFNEARRRKNRNTARRIFADDNMYHQQCNVDTENNSQHFSEFGRDSRNRSLVVRQGGEGFAGTIPEADNVMEVRDNEKHTLFHTPASYLHSLMSSVLLICVPYRMIAFCQTQIN